MDIFAENYRGFKWVEIDLDKVNFLVGDNTSGKSSIIYLIHAIAKNDLREVPRFDDAFGIGEYDYFSPYFDCAEVTFGYSSGDASFAKLLTVKQRKKFSPEITRCSYFSDGKFVSFRIDKRRLQSKIIDIEFISRRNLLDHHKSEDGYRTTNIEEKIELSDPALILAVFDQAVNKGARRVFSEAHDNILDGMRLVSPTRALPEQFYTFRRKFSPHGLHFATLWMDISDAQRSEGMEDIEKFGRESGLFDRVNVRRISRKFVDSPLMVSIEKNNKEFLLNQVGVGVSQVVPVLIDTFYVLNVSDVSILMQQPELHLHPIAQAALGSYLFQAVAKGLRPVIETHSSFLIDRFRSDLRDTIRDSHADGGGISPEDVKIIFCSNELDGNKMREIAIEPDGTLRGDPEEFHKFFVDEIVRTMF